MSKATYVVDAPNGISAYEFNMLAEKIQCVADSQFAKGLRAYLKSDDGKALQFLKFGFSRREISDIKKVDPFIVGLYGLLLAKVEKNFYQAKQYACLALEFSQDSPEVIMIQGQIHEECNEYDSALETYRVGIRKYPNNKEFLRRLQKLNPRRKKVISFLARENIINKALGKLLSSSGQ